MFQCLRCRYTIVCVVDEQFLDQVNDFRAGLGDKFGNACTLDSSHAELSKVHVTGMALELVKEGFLRRAEYVMYLVHLVELIITGKEWEKRDDFEHDTTDTPKVHLVTVVTISEEAFRCTIPTR